ncbi:MAG TPA: hypothetical protein VGE81_07635 [Candidatus Limnocylindrales bacterium]|nr:hypothetical protein [Chloroflexota bacterium]
MSPPTDIWLKPGQILLILGQTQSGKSVLATSAAASVESGTLVIVDPKGDPGALVPNCAVTTSALEVVRRLPGRVCWTPDREELGDLPGAWDRICSRLLKLAESGYSSVIVVHELGDLCTEARIGPAFRQLVTQGAQIAGGAGAGGGHITQIYVSQRPRHIWGDVKSNARHIVCMTLTNLDDREEAARLMNDIYEPEKARRLIVPFALPLDHSWWYLSPEYRLTLHTPVELPH